MQIEVRHRTTYSYSTPARYSVQSLRLTPQAFDGQRVVRWSIDAPGIEKALQFRDACGDLVHQITVTGVHDEIVVEASGVIETEERHGVVRGLRDTAPLRFYLRQTPATAPSPKILTLVAALDPGTTLERLHQLADRIRDTVEYELGATGAHTSGAEALRDGRGVCQDHTHIFLSAAREMGIPSRYVTGYLLVAGSEAEDGETTHAQHAWAEAWIDDLGWIGFDVANRICPTEAYVRLASGLDARHAAPVRGCRRGGEVENLEVQVRVLQQKSAQQ